MNLKQVHVGESATDADLSVSASYAKTNKIRILPNKDHKAYDARLAGR